MTDDRKIRFAKMKLVGLAQMWWYGLEGRIRRLELPPINTWQAMKTKLQEKYMPSHYHVKDCEQHGRGNSRPVSNLFEECMQRLDAINTHNRVAASSRLNIARLDTTTKPPLPKQASVGHAHQVTPNPKGVVKDTSSTKLMSKAIDYVPNPAGVEEDQISMPKNAPVVEVAKVATQESRVPCAVETNKPKQSAPKSKNSMPLHEMENVMEMGVGEVKETSPESNMPSQMGMLLSDSSSTVVKEFPVEKVNSRNHGKLKGPPTIDVIRKEVNVKLQEGNVTTREMGPIIDFVIPDKFKDPHVESKASLSSFLFETKKVKESMFNVSLEV
ncbi:hypothetical protein RHGRI_030994 [Rhododendron griersonianum]|uniref:Retrotransposon gag domain-containing protein n=1 Tax=Rhododendron griersonianum TaxID=479676 RepID=A0AAV6I8S3_9ERIC|nr:hypothetical protein RHGRI_030994 [Rhododendron griersonianum]